MSERDKQILEKIEKALPHMDDFDKGVLVGTADAHMERGEKKDDAGES